jgi:hypothetical protein
MPTFWVRRNNWRSQDARAAFIAPAPRVGRSETLLFNPHEKHPAGADNDLVALPDGGCRHLVAIDHHKLGIRGRFDFESLSFPADAPVNWPDSGPLEHDVARRTCSEQDGMIASQFNELDTTLSIVNFESGHETPYLSVSWATTSKS